MAHCQVDSKVEFQREGRWALTLPGPSLCDAHWLLVSLRITKVKPCCQGDSSKGPVWVEALYPTEGFLQHKTAQRSLIWPLEKPNEKRDAEALCG